MGRTGSRGEAALATVRIDRWLCAARLYRSRSQAQQGCSAGRVRLNESLAKPHQLVRVGDSIEVQRERRRIVVGVRALAAKRLSPPLARELYDDHSPPPPPREERMAVRERGAGRPTKRDRRALRRVRGR